MAYPYEHFFRCSVNIIYNVQNTPFIPVKN